MKPPANLFVLAATAAIAGCSINGALAPLSQRSYLSALPPAANGYRSLYSFAQYGKPDDGNAPAAHLLALGSTLYGTTQYGGATTSDCSVGCGTIFATSKSGNERVLYRFKGGADGSAPTAALIRLNGSFFGTTSHGGSGACSGGCGTIFKTDATGKIEGAIHSFAGAKDGAMPLAKLIAVRGVLYGTTAYGGIHGGMCFSGCGTVFKVTTSGREQVIYRFKGGADGAVPLAGLTALGTALYGTTQFGGTRTPLCSIGCGTVFRVDAAGKESVIYRFRFSPQRRDAAYPAADLVVLKGLLYGTTLSGGSAESGTVFTVNQSNGAERILHSFGTGGKTDGGHPVAQLTILRGTFFGTTRDGGSASRGTIFKMTPAGEETLLYNFQGKPDGATPVAGLTLLSGAFYGTTQVGGSAGEGTIFTVR